MTSNNNFSIIWLNPRVIDIFFLHNRDSDCCQLWKHSQRWPSSGTKYQQFPRYASPLFPLNHITLSPVFPLHFSGCFRFCTLSALLHSFFSYLPPLFHIRSSSSRGGFTVVLILKWDETDLMSGFMFHISALLKWDVHYLKSDTYTHLVQETLWQNKAESN